MLSLVPLEKSSVGTRIYKKKGGLKDVVGIRHAHSLTYRENARQKGEVPGLIATGTSCCETEESLGFVRTSFALVRIFPCVRQWYYEEALHSAASDIRWWSCTLYTHGSDGRLQAICGTRVVRRREKVHGGEQCFTHVYCRLQRLSDRMIDMDDSNKNFVAVASPSGFPPLTKSTKVRFHGSHFLARFDAHKHRRRRWMTL